MITMFPIASVVGGRRDPIDDDWGDETATIRLDKARFTPESLRGLDEFSHVEVVFVFNQVRQNEITLDARHPRGNPAWPKVGIFAQRAKARPNRIGLTTCELIGVDGLDVVVRGLDALDGTPVLDVKPYMAEFAPRTPTTQPQWATELMAGYW
jgi:tRNA (adenine37-N6)-methyltransferase